VLVLLLLVLVFVLLLPLVLLAPFSHWSLMIKLGLGNFEFAVLSLISVF